MFLLKNTSVNCGNEAALNEQVSRRQAVGVAAIHSLCSDSGGLVSLTLATRSPSELVKSTHRGTNTNLPVRYSGLVSLTLAPRSPSELVKSPHRGTKTNLPVRYMAGWVANEPTVRSWHKCEVGYVRFEGRGEG